MNVGWIDNGDWIKVKGVGFGAGATSFTARVASAAAGGRIEVRLDGASGAVAGTCTVPGTGGWQTWTTVSCAVTGATGTRDLYLRFAGGTGSLFNLNWWQFAGGGGGNLLTNGAMESGTSGWSVFGGGALSTSTPRARRRQRTRDHRTHRVVARSEPEPDLDARQRPQLHDVRVGAHTERAHPPRR